VTTGKPAAIPEMGSESLSQFGTARWGRCRQNLSQYKRLLLLYLALDWLLDPAALYGNITIGTSDARLNGPSCPGTDPEATVSNMDRDIFGANTRQVRHDKDNKLLI